MTDEEYNTLINARTAHGLQQAGVAPPTPEVGNALSKLEMMRRGSSPTNDWLTWLMKLFMGK